MSGDTAIWLDGERIAALPLPDRGLDFGDGLFETLLVREGRPLYSELHLERLARGCKVLMFPDCSARVQEQMYLAAEATGASSCAMRITLTRGSGPRGYAPPPITAPRVVISTTRLDTPVQAKPLPARLGVASIRLATQPALAGIKHLNRLEQVLAAQEYCGQGLDEAVMLDQQGRVISVVAGNLFLAIDKELLTPAIGDCGVAGTRRALIRQRWAPAIGLGVREEVISALQLEQADEVFYCNSLVGLRPVASIGSRSWNAHPMCEALYRHYLSELA